jgi:hypothetical protein
MFTTNYGIRNLLQWRFCQTFSVQSHNETVHISWSHGPTIHEVNMLLNNHFNYRNVKLVYFRHTVENGRSY